MSDKKPIRIKLYNLPQNIDGGVRIYGHKIKGEEVELLFHSLDGMHSHCTVDGEDKPIALRAITPLLKHEDGWKIEGAE
jgi:hypothetical protein